MQQLIKKVQATENNLITSKSTNKIPFMTNGLSADAGDKLAQIALENLSYMKDAFYYQIATQDDDIHVVWYVVSGSGSRIEEAEISFIKWIIELDQYLSIATNPFKFLSKEVIESSDSVLNFIDNYEEMLTE
ncbi:hypothetical protein [Carnobacterium maltaromaticum]